MKNLLAITLAVITAATAFAQSGPRFGRETDYTQQLKTNENREGWFEALITDGSISSNKLEPDTLNLLLSGSNGVLNADGLIYDDDLDNYAADRVGPAIDELFSTNPEGPNATNGKVSWYQLVDVPAGFADNADDAGSELLNIIYEDEGNTIVLTNEPDGTNVSLRVSGEILVDYIVAESMAGDGSQLKYLMGMFNVKDYGATGDGVTDDRAAIQLAIDSAETNGGAVYFPPGTYIIGTSSTYPTYTDVTGLAGALTIKSNNVHLVGSGIGATTLIRSGGTKYGNFINSFFTTNCSIQGITFDGGDDLCWNLTSLYTNDFWTFKDSRWINHDDDGVEMGEGGRFWFERCTFSNIAANAIAMNDVEFGFVNDVLIQDSGKKHHTNYTITPTHYPGNWAAFQVREGKYLVNNLRFENCPTTVQFIGEEIQFSNCRFGGGVGVPGIAQTNMFLCAGKAMLDNVYFDNIYSTNLAIYGGELRSYDSTLVGSGSILKINNANAQITGRFVEMVRENSYIKNSEIWANASVANIRMSTGTNQSLSGNIIQNNGTTAVFMDADNSRVEHNDFISGSLAVSGANSIIKNNDFRVLGHFYVQAGSAGGVFHDNSVYNVTFQSTQIWNIYDNEIKGTISGTGAPPAPANQIAAAIWGYNWDSNGDHINIDNEIHAFSGEVLVTNSADATYVRATNGNIHMSGRIYGNITVNDVNETNAVNMTDNLELLKPTIEKIKADTGLTKILILGDSMGTPPATTDPASGTQSSVVAGIVHSMAEDYNLAGAVGLGHNNLLARTLSGVTLDAATDATWFGYRLTVTNGTSFIQKKDSETNGEIADTLGVWWVAGPQGGDFTLESSVDGASFSTEKTLSGFNATPTLMHTNVTVKRGRVRGQISCATDTTNHILGLEIYDSSQNGVLPWFVYWPGSNIGQMVSPSNVLYEAVSEFDPDLVLVHFYDRYDIGEATAESNFTNTLANILAATTAPVVNLGPLHRGDAGEAETDDENVMNRRISVDMDWVFLDLYQMGESYAVQNARGWMIDNVHVDVSGGQETGDWGARILGLQEKPVRNTHTPHLRASGTNVAYLSMIDGIGGQNPYESVRLSGSTQPKLSTGRSDSWTTSVQYHAPFLLFKQADGTFDHASWEIPAGPLGARNYRITAYWLSTNATTFPPYTQVSSVNEFGEVISLNQTTTDWTYSSSTTNIEAYVKEYTLPQSPIGPVGITIGVGDTAVTNDMWLLSAKVEWW